MTDVITQVEKVNADLAENEIKLSFKLPEGLIKAFNGAWIEYSLALEDGGPKIDGHFNISGQHHEQTHKFTGADTKTLFKEIRKRELVMKLKKKKFLFTEEVEAATVKMQDLFTQCTITKSNKV